MNDSTIESMLRRAPVPCPPAALLYRLHADVRVSTAKTNVRESSFLHLLQRWWPVISCLVIGVTMASGKFTAIAKLRHENESLRAPTAQIDNLRQKNAEYQQLTATVSEVKRLEANYSELQALKADAARLRLAIAEGEKVKADNQRLLSELRLPPDALGQGLFSKAKSARCINTLKRIVVAARIWATENNKDVFPSSFIAMKDELSTPKILVCSSDEGKIAAPDWEGFTEANNSYEMLSPGVSELEPQVVYVRCRVHGHVAMVDGSVQASKRSVSVVQKDGQWILLEQNEN
ncbi:MAG: hypothetical protein JWM99_5231 [Verrucomicrobiales bacterium]|nr:hypothetical protein [Verrucomicrobiales bacterium]